MSRALAHSPKWHLNEMLGYNTLCKPVCRSFLSFVSPSLYHFRGHACKGGCVSMKYVQSRAKLWLPDPAFLSGRMTQLSQVADAVDCRRGLQPSFQNPSAIPSLGENMCLWSTLQLWVCVCVCVHVFSHSRAEVRYKQLLLHFEWGGRGQHFLLCLRHKMSAPVIIEGFSII